MSLPSVTPSNIEYRSKCPYWVSAPMSDRAQRGISIHDEIASVLRGNDRRDDLDEAARLCVEYATDVVMRYVMQQVPMGAVYVEQFVGADCRADLIVEDGTQAVIVEWKTGYGERPTARDSLQLAMEAWSLARENRDLETITVVMAELDRGHMTVHEYSGDILRDSGDMRMRELIRRCETPGRICSGTHCRRCDRAPLCPEARRVIEALPIDIPVDDMAGYQIAEAQEMAEQVRAWLGAVQDRAHTMAAANALPGWALKSGRPTRKWRDDIDLEAVLTEAAFRKGDEDFSPRKPGQIKSPNEVEKELGRSKFIKEIIGRAVVMVPGRPKLVKDES